MLPIMNSFRNSFGSRLLHGSSSCTHPLCLCLAGFLVAAGPVPGAPAGRLLGWGAIGLPDVPPRTQYTNIASGLEWCLAATTGGKLVGWGYNAGGQCVTPGNVTSPLAIAAGANHAVALKADHTLVAWGDNGSGQTNIPHGLTNVVAISCNGNYSLALRDDGMVAVWGYLA